MNKLTAVGAFSALGLLCWTAPAGFEEAASVPPSPPAVLGDTGVASLGVEELLTHFTVVAELPEAGRLRTRMSTDAGT
jgi:hypothetical protein